MLLCMLFVAFQLLQATIVHYLYESGKLKSEAKERERKVAQIFASSSNKKDENQVLERNEEFLQGENLEKRKKIPNGKRGQGKEWIREQKMRGKRGAKDDGRVMSSTTTSTTMEAEEEEVGSVMFVTVASSKTSHSFTLSFFLSVPLSFFLSSSSSLLLTWRH